MPAIREARQIVFQSAPRSEERGDAIESEAVNSLSCFNPRPAPKSGAMGALSRRRWSTGCFNPRPAPKSGAID